MVGGHAALGRIQVNTPPKLWAISLIAAAFFCASCAYLCLGHYTRRVTAYGMLVPAAGLITLRATGIGQVLRLAVRQDQRVVAGQVLAELDNPVDSATLGNTMSLVTSELDSERRGLQENLQTHQTLAASQEAALRANIVSLQAQLTQNSGQLALQRRQAAAMAALLERIRPLSTQGYISVYDLQQQQAATYNAEMQIKVLQSQRLAMQQQIIGAKAQLRQIPLTLATQQNDTRAKLVQVDQDLAQNEAQRAWVVKAPKEGIVSTLLVRPGQAVTTGQALLVVVPSESPLEAQLLVPSSAIGFVRAGDRVLLRYQAFPYEKFGVHFGVVSQVSRSALLPPEVADLVGQEVGTPLYRVSVRIDDQAVAAYGQFITLRPGMEVSADILLDRRRLIEWVVEPLYRFRPT